MRANNYNYASEYHTSLRSSILLTREMQKQQSDEMDFPVRHAIFSYEFGRQAIQGPIHLIMTFIGCLVDGC